MILVVLTAYSSHADCNIPLQAAIVALPGILSRYSTSARLYIYLIYSFDWSFLSTLFTHKWINLFIPLAALPGVLSWCSTSENEMPPNFLMVFYSSISNLILVKKKRSGFWWIGRKGFQFLDSFCVSSFVRIYYPCPDRYRNSMLSITTTSTNTTKLLGPAVPEYQHHQNY